MKARGLHFVMCLPMVLAAIVLVLGGAGAIAIAPAVVCALMMVVMLAAAGRDGRRGSDRP